MLVERFRDSPVGSIVPINGFDQRFGEHYEQFAFVPVPLPDRVELSGDTVAVVADAMLSLGRLDQAGRQIPNPALLRRPTLRREAQATSALAGTYAPLTEVLEADPDDLPRRSRELAEVMNYVTAAEHAFATVPGRRLSLRLVLELHQLLVRGTRSDGPDAGRVRTQQVVIGSSTRVLNARFVPPPPGTELEAQLRDWVDWVNDPRPAVPPVVAAALAHYQFETLHPLNDGNGRIGRLLIVVHLVLRGVLHEPFLTVSPWFETRRTDYQDELQRVSETGDYDRWVRYFTTGIRDQAGETTRKIDELVRLHNRARDTCRKNSVRGVALEVAEGLVGRPIITPTWVQRNYGVSYPAANKAVTRLEELGLVRETTGGNYGRIYAADDVLRLLER